MAKPYWQKCARSRLLRAVMDEALPINVVILRAKGEAEARLRLIEAGKAYCVAKCGGCPMTEGYVPPA